MKKLTALMLALMLALAMVPATGLAAGTTIDVKDVIAAKGYTFGGNSTPYALSGTEAYINVSAGSALFTELFAENTTIVNSSYTGTTYMCKINIHGNNYTLKNITFGEGVILEVGATDGQTVTIEGCTFDGPAFSGGTRYAITMGGGNLVLTNNNFNGAYRGVNMRAATPNASLVATGNTFSVTEYAGDMKNIGIQLSSGIAWSASNTVNVSNNTFINAWAALRLHDGILIAPGIGETKFITFNNNTLINTPRGVAMDPDTAAAKIPLLQSVITNNVTETGTNTGTVVTAGVDPTFTITIPAAVDFGKVAKGTDDVVRDFVVSASGVVIETNKQINVSVTSDFLLSGGGTTLAYRLYNNDAADATVIGTGGLFASFTENGNKDGNVKLDRSQITVAAAYQDTMVFTIAYVNKP